MSLGTFSGPRLRDARLARGMTASVLAERVGISSASISHYELRNAEPRGETMSKIAAVLGLPQAYFLRPVIARDAAPIHCRSQSSATKRARDSAEARLTWLREIVINIETDVEFPSPRVPHFSIPTNPHAITDDHIECAARDVRAEWKLGDGPIPDVVGLIELMGCVVSAFAFGAARLSAFSQNGNDRPYVVLNADESACARWRFNAAHELGHLVLHRNVTAAEAANSTTHKVLENQAHRFASALLLPPRTFADEMYSMTVEALLQFKARWRVSMQATVRRAWDLRLISSDQYERTMRDLSRRGYRTSEPLDEDVPTESPQLLSRSIQLLVDEGVTSKDELLHRLPFSDVDVEVLAGLPRGYLGSPAWGQVAELRLRQQPSPSEPTTTPPAGTLLQFRPKRA